MNPTHPSSGNAPDFSMLLSGLGLIPGSLACLFLLGPLLYVAWPRSRHFTQSACGNALHVLIGLLSVLASLAVVAVGIFVPWWIFHAWNGRAPSEEPLPLWISATALGVIVLGAANIGHLSAKALSDIDMDEWDEAIFSVAISILTVLGVAGLCGMFSLVSRSLDASPHPVGLLPLIPGGVFLALFAAFCIRERRERRAETA